MPKKLEISARFSAIDSISDKIDRIEDNIDRFSRHAVRSMRAPRRSASRLTKMFQKMSIASMSLKMASSVLGAIKNALGGIAGIVVDIIEVGSRFEKTLDKASAKMGGIKKGSKDYLELKTVAEKVGEATEFSASQAAEGLEYLAMAGFNAKQSITALPKLVNVATAADLDFQRSTDIVSDSLGAFGLMTKDTTKLLSRLLRVSDVMAYTVTKSNTSMEALFEAFKKAGPVATAFGADIETTSSILATLAGNGQKGEEAGTALKNIFLRLQAPASAGAKAIKKLGLGITDKIGKFRDIISIFGDMKKKLDRLSPKKRAQILSDIFGKKAITAAQNILKSIKTVHAPYKKTIDLTDEFRRKAYAATGAAGNMAKQIRGNVAGSIASLRSKFESLKLKVFDAMVPILHMIIPRLSKIVTQVTEWAKANKALITEKLIEGFHTLWGILGATAKAIESLIGLINKVGKAWEAVAGPAVKFQKGESEESKKNKVAEYMMTRSTPLSYLADYVSRQFSSPKQATKASSGKESTKVDITVHTPDKRISARTKGKNIGKFSVKQGRTRPIAAGAL